MDNERGFKAKECCLEENRVLIKTPRLSNSRNEKKQQQWVVQRKKHERLGYLLCRNK